MSFDYRKYPAYRPVQLTDRTWPDMMLEQAPAWCSVDLRDGNQALIDPMTVAEKKQLFALLVKVGFKEIEVGFPAASQPDFDFVRALIEEDLIPADVTIQVLTQARQDLIERSFEALRGSRQAIVHLYNSTSPVQREQVFGMSADAIVGIAEQGARWVRDGAERYPETTWQFQYSPESYSGTEPDFAARICNAVIDIWHPVAQRPIIINLPATVEMTTPNVFADQVELFCRQVKHREEIIVSLHTHNDRGCAVAAAELGMMAGADRIEGTLLGNGERTGNMDIVTMAMNLYSRGVDPQLDLADMDGIISTVQAVTKLPVHPRHPYAGDLVFTAFSGSHQDAIRKCLTKRSADAPWDVAYLPIDPEDIGRSYEAVVRINSQSGKGGVTFVLEKDHGITPPRWLQIALSRAVQAEAERTGKEMSSDQIWQVFEQDFMGSGALAVEGYRYRHDPDSELTCQLQTASGLVELRAEGNGALSAFCDALSRHFNVALNILDYEEHALQHSSDAEAVAMVQVNSGGERFSGTAIHTDAVLASLMAVLAAVSRIPAIQIQAAA